ncbi:MAG: YbaK/EbsC family protein [Gammaproteobacteria bacterium]
MTQMPAEDIHASIAQLLADSRLEHEILPCPPELADTNIFCEHYGVPLTRSANTIVVKSKPGERFVACVLLADSKLAVNRVIRKRLSARKVSFASAEETRTLTGMELGGVTPIGLPQALSLWVDARVMEQPYIVLGGGDRNSKIKVDPAIFNHIPGVEIVPELAEPRE